MVDLTLPLPGLSPIAGKEVVARFDGGRLSSDGGLLLLREIERRLAVAERLAACIEDRRDPGSTLHPLADIIRFRLLMIAAGYEDGNDATSLRVDPVFKMALERLPSGRDLCSQSTISRLEIRGNWPQVAILVRADSHYACPEVLDWCEANGIDYVFGLAPTSTWTRHVGALEASTLARFRVDPSGGKVRRFKEFFDAAHTWSRVRRIVARVEAGSDGTDTRFIVTTLGHGSGRSLYQDLYCRRGQAENHIKAWKTHLAADRTSCPKATANQFRLFLHAGAYWLLWSLRALMPRASSWRVAQFDTLRRRLIKVAARVVELKTKIKVHLPTSAPDQSILHLALGRLPRLVT